MLVACGYTHTPAGSVMDLGVAYFCGFLTLVCWIGVDV